MRCKALQVTVELELQAITCPGVWLCPSGRITAQIHMLNAYSQTSAMKPVFPLLCHEKFVFQKSFYDIRKLRDVEKYLHKEYLYIELIQWKNCDAGNVLATFKTSLTELLYPPPWCKGAAVGVDVDLLMEATRLFPGIISPKLEVSTRTTIEEVLCRLPATKTKIDQICTKPKIPTPKCNVPKRNVPIRQKKVCHTYEYHKAKLGNHEARKKLIYSDNESYSSPEDCRHTKMKMKAPIKVSVCSNSPGKIRTCSVCTRYDDYTDEPNKVKSKGTKRSSRKDTCKYFSKGSDECIDYFPCKCDIGIQHNACWDDETESLKIQSRSCSACSQYNKDKNYSVDINVFNRRNPPEVKCKNCHCDIETKCRSKSKSKNRSEHVESSLNINLCDCNKCNTMNTKIKSNRTKKKNNYHCRCYDSDDTNNYHEPPDRPRQKCHCEKNADVYSKYEKNNDIYDRYEKVFRPCAYG